MGLEPKTGDHNWQGEEDSLKSHSDHGKCQRMKLLAEAQAEALAAAQAEALAAATLATEATAVAKF